MLAPLYVSLLRGSERVALEQGLRSKAVFTLRRCQLLLVSAKGTKPKDIETYVGCSVQTVRNTIHAFVQQG